MFMALCTLHSTNSLIKQHMPCFSSQISNILLWFRRYGPHAVCRRKESNYDCRQSNRESFPVQCLSLPLLAFANLRNSDAIIHNNLTDVVTTEFQESCTSPTHANYNCWSYFRNSYLTASLALEMRFFTMVLNSITGSEVGTSSLIPASQLGARVARQFGHCADHSFTSFKQLSWNVCWFSS